ncbi:MAG: class I SAM-dependent methyltransferase [Acidobacteriaceae bacterium]|nr:class I SAM-dependent methyltransferase [Acidobacteriaceae bacterium]
MESPFGETSIATGYAQFRPPLHKRIMERVRERLPPLRNFAYALDVGCGTGLSTEALSGLADLRIGLEPAEAMLQWSRTVAPGAQFIAAAAEAIPLRAQSIDLITAAGSLNYTDLPQCLREAARVLKTEGTLVVYDFGPGRSFRDSTSLDQWFVEFTTRYPWPPNEAQEISPEILKQTAGSFRVEDAEHLQIGITLTPDFYTRYMLTETNVAFALRNGTKLEEIRLWCEETLRPVWNGESHEVLFRGYYACLRRR